MLTSNVYQNDFNRNGGEVPFKKGISALQVHRMIGMGSYRTASDTLNEFVRETVSHKVSLISTDEHLSYRQLDRTFPHGMVNHGAGEYVHGNIHTNNIESFWSIFKRGVIGTFHKVSRKYLPLYVAEFQFRHNNRMNPDIFSAAIKEC